jgi:hypothetical protein
MQFHRFTISVTLTIAATVALQSVGHASTEYDSITKQIGLQAAQSQSIQPESSVQNISINQEGQTFFSDPPQLIRSAASQLGANVPSTYEFTLTVPKDAGQPLKAVKVVQAENMETINFDLGNSKAFLGDRFAGGSEIQLASIGGEQPANPGEVTIAFDQPVQPGSTITVAVAAQHNPNWSGVYLFGVTAYPAGENGLGQFLGYGRINFHGNAG